MYHIYVLSVCVYIHMFIYYTYTLSFSREMSVSVGFDVGLRRCNLWKRSSKALDQDGSSASTPLGESVPNGRRRWARFVGPTLWSSTHERWLSQGALPVRKRLVARNGSLQTAGSAGSVLRHHAA